MRKPCAEEDVVAEDQRDIVSACTHLFSDRAMTGRLGLCLPPEHDLMGRGDHLAD